MVLTLLALAAVLVAYSFYKVSKSPPNDKMTDVIK